MYVAMNVLTKNKPGTCILHIRLCSTFYKKEELYKKCFAVLGVEEFSDQNTIRSAYIKLVKKVHPDSGQPEASAEKFQEIDSAFKVLQARFAKLRRGIDENLQEEVKIFDIKHTAPQHRQYLSFDGVGTGSPFQREKQYQQRRAQTAAERVMEHRLQKSYATEKTVMKKGEFFKNHAIKTKYGFDRVVEDLIQESMSKGDFNNLTGSGKPLSETQQQNPYVDFTTAKLNKILLDNGFTPEWIMLQKEIREEIFDLKQRLSVKRQEYGAAPLSGQDEQKWNKAVESYQTLIDGINKRIDKYNLIVPIMHKQMVQIRLEKIAAKILAQPEKDSGQYDKMKQQSTVNVSHEKQNEKSNLLSYIGQFFN